MTTLQEKIDAICPYHKEKNKVCEYCTVRENQNKAIQELGEEIKNLLLADCQLKDSRDNFNWTDWTDGYNDALYNVLSLIGEKK